MKKLLIIVPCISYGGLENVAITTAEALCTQYDVTLLYFYSSDKEIPTNIPKICLDIPYSLNLLGQIKVILTRHFALCRYKKELKPDICLAIGKVASISNILSKGCSRCIASLHGYTDVPRAKLVAFVTKLLFGFADKTICVSKALAEEFIRATSIARNKVVSCANPFDVPALIAQSNESVDIPTLQGNPKLFAFGRLVEGKNFELALEAVHLLKDEFPDIHLSLAGDGEHFNSLQQMAATLDLTAHVSFLGMLPNPFAALKQADLLLNPSWNEGFGNTVVESFLCGVPVIATDCKVGPRENISPSSDLMHIATEVEFAEYGVLLPPSYPSDTIEQRSAKAAVLADATRILLQDDALRTSYAEKGKARMQQYALPYYIAQLTDILEN
ncbi:MAG: glycosyltransferase [Faecalibacterium sp.]